MSRQPAPPLDFHALLHAARERTRPLTAKTPSREELNDARVAIRRAAMSGNAHPALLPLVHDAEVAITTSLDDKKGVAELVEKADGLLATVLGTIHLTDPD